MTTYEAPKNRFSFLFYAQSQVIFMAAIKNAVWIFDTDFLFAAEIALCNIKIDLLHIVEFRIFFISVVCAFGGPLSVLKPSYLLGYSLSFFCIILNDYNFDNDLIALMKNNWTIDGKFKALRIKKIWMVDKSIFVLIDHIDTRFANNIQLKIVNYYKIISFGHTKWRLCYEPVSFIIFSSSVRNMTGEGFSTTPSVLYALHGNFICYEWDNLQ